jgi:putative (di)nucleoside polyphosphate hydrolase
MFRANAGIVLANGKGEVLALELIMIPGAWQLPQGGIEDEEEPVESALRELREETGISAEQVELVAECPDWLAYELPRDKWSAKLGRGQVQRWFLFRLRDLRAEVVLDRCDHVEFRSWRWMSLNELAEITVAFRRNIYRRLFEDYLK